MRTDVAIDKLCNIAPVLAELSEKLSNDTEFKMFMTEKSERTNRDFLFKVVPHLLKNYREEAFNILSVWNDKTVEEVKGQSFGKTITEIKAIFEDEAFRSFFSSSSASDSVVVE